MRLADTDINVPGIRDIPGTVAEVTRRVASLAGRPIDHVALCVEAANLQRYIGQVRQKLPASLLGEFQIGEPDSGMRIAAIEDTASEIHVVLVAPSGSKGQLAEFLARTGAEGLQHIAFAVPDLRAAMSCAAAEGLKFAGGSENLDRAILEVREGDRWLRQTFTEPVFGEFFVELIERHGITGMDPRNIQSLYDLNESSREERQPLPA
ncbi:MAG: VOC family protein [Gammaproteobacteria bacterium]|nr:VOC family protein [Gammaproteobacteria bacterium]